MGYRQGGEANAHIRGLHSTSVRGNAFYIFMEGFLRFMPHRAHMTTHSPRHSYKEDDAEEDICKNFIASCGLFIKYVHCRINSQAVNIRETVPYIDIAFHASLFTVKKS